MAAAVTYAVGERCPACQAGVEPLMVGVRDTIGGELFSVACCAECGAGVTMPAPARVEDYYGPRYYGSRHSFTRQFCTWRRLRILGRHAGDGKSRRLLDVGSGEGDFLEAASRAGWTAAGIETHRPLDRHPQLVFHSLAEAAAMGPYHCITLWHVMEHVPDPLGYAARLRSMLAPGGVLIAAVPDFGGLQARLFGRHWLHLDVPRHLHHFTRPALHRLLDAAGFERLHTAHQELEYDCFGWIQSALNTLLGAPNILFDSLTGKPPRVGRARVAACFLDGVVMVLPALALTLASTLARRGGTLIVAARARQV